MDWTREPLHLDLRGDKSATVFIAPVGTPAETLFSSPFDERWQLLHPAVPDAPPADLGEA